MRAIIVHPMSLAVAEGACRPAQAPVPLQQLRIARVSRTPCECVHPCVLHRRCFSSTCGGCRTCQHAQSNCCHCRFQSMHLVRLQGAFEENDP